jgi:CheY-like chemotaxis protein
MSETDLAAKTLSILHVEDDFADALLVETAIGKSGLKITSLVHVDRFGESLRHLRNNPVDLILLDVNLPDTAVLRFDVLALRRCSAAPIIFVTDMPPEAIADTLHENPSLRFLGKSEFTPANFAALVQEIFGVNENQHTPSEDNHLHRFEGVLNAMQDAVFVMDADGEIYWANDRAEALIPHNPLAPLTDIFLHGRTAPSRVKAVIRNDSDQVFDVSINPLMDRAVQEELYVAVFREKLD